ncbi:MAG: T9SS type A sorting domain-containing protein, partial [Bacteroidota bacterium]
GTFSSGTGNIRDIEPDVTYDPSHHKFYTTWSDSLTAKLKCSLNDIDLQTGGAWTLFYDGYNDGTNISNPFPKVKVNPVSQEVIHVWDGDLTATRTNATFDKSYVPVGVQDAAEPSKFSFNVSPNPSQGQADISFSLSRDELVYANLYDLSGRQVFAIAPQNFSSGNHRIRLNADQLEPACYIVQLHCGSVVATQRMIIIR